MKLLFVALFVVAFFAIDTKAQFTVTIYASNEFDFGACYSPFYFIPFVINNSAPSHLWGNAYTSVLYLPSNNSLVLQCNDDINPAGNCTRFSSVEVADWRNNVAIDYLQENNCVIVYYSSLYKYSKSCYTEWICLQEPATAKLSTTTPHNHIARTTSNKFAALRQAELQLN